jgi:guanylate cyclase
MMNLFPKSALDISATPSDTSDERARKRLFVLVLLAGSLVAILFGGLLLWQDAILAGSAWLAWGLWHWLVILVIQRSRQVSETLAGTHLLLIILAPFVVFSLLGSFTQFGYAFYALTAPILALVLAPGQVKRLAVICAVAILGGFGLQAGLGLSPWLPDWLAFSWLGVNMALAGFSVYFVVSFSFAQRDRFQRKLLNEQNKTERLLLSIFPEKIAAQVKNSLLDESTVPVIAEHYKNASVLFADMVNFTPMSARLEAVDLVSMLNAIFSRFDRLAGKHGLEKIKTVGDCYMVAAGVPQPRSDHAHALAELALEIQAFVKANRFANQRVSFRIGISSGPLVAGVVGQRKISYDLWGDTVNIASRMTSRGIAGGIQITQPTYELLKDAYICVPRGKIFVKGKGDMDIWLLTGKQNS